MSTGGRSPRLRFLRGGLKIVDEPIELVSRVDARQGVRRRERLDATFSGGRRDLVV